MSDPVKNHGRNHRKGGSDAIPGIGFGGSGKPRILDYFDNSGGSRHLEPPQASPGSNLQSSNWVVWSEQANWSGYQSPEPWIAVDDAVYGNDSYGNPIHNRWVYMPTKGTDSDFVSPGGSALLRCEFSMEVPDNVEKWWDVQVFMDHRDTPPDGTPWNNPGGIGSAVGGNYGWRSEFPFLASRPAQSTIGDWRPRPSLAFYQQVSAGVYTGFAFLLKQSFPNGDPVNDFEEFPYCQLIVEIVKDDAFEGERGGTDTGGDGGGGVAAAMPVHAVAGLLSPHNDGLRWYAPDAGTISQIHCSVGTAPAGSGVTVRVNKNGSSIGTVTIPAGSNVATLVPVAAAFAQDDYFTIDVTAVGSTTPGSDLVVQIR